MKTGGASEAKVSFCKNAVPMQISLTRELISSTTIDLCDTLAGGKKLSCKPTGPGEAFMIGTGRYPRSANTKASLIESAPGRSITTALSGLALCSFQIGAGASTLASAQ